ncbi:serine/threonine-protein kinase 10-like [Pogoniulus pusillus]|uniref:serine/threonine-protein kinase 10-like n=1 Tax=Pogoniulus pusillus TaxID=488313 RepID=UPI0030B96C50
MHEFENIKKNFLDLQDLISLKSTALLNEETLVAKLKEKGKELEKNLEMKKTDVLILSEQKLQLDSELLLLQSKIAQEKEDFNKELEKTKEDLHSAECLNKDLKLENKAVHQKYEQTLEEEQQWAVKRDEMVTKLRNLSVLLDEELALVENHMMKKKHLEEEIETLRGSLRNAKERHAEELASLKQDFKTENKTRIMLQWKLLYLALQRKLFFTEEENMNREVNERREAGKKRHAELLLEIEHLDEEISQTENQVKVLSEEAVKKENHWNNYKEDFTNTLKSLELELRNKLHQRRGAAAGQVRSHTESVKLLERDIYEASRKLDIVNTENCRFKLCNAQMKEAIFALHSEAETLKSATAKLLTDLAAHHDLLLKEWSEESSVRKQFLEDEQEILSAVTALTTEVRQRQEKIGDINCRLQNKLQALNSLLDKKSRMDNPPKTH